MYPFLYNYTDSEPASRAFFSLRGRMRLTLFNKFIYKCFFYNEGEFRARDVRNVSAVFIVACLDVFIQYKFFIGMNLRKSQGHYSTYIKIVSS